MALTVIVSAWFMLLRFMSRMAHLTRQQRLSLFLVVALVLSLFPAMPAQAGKKSSSWNLSKTVTPTVAVAGQTVTYTITITNGGNANGSYHIVDSLPTNITYVAGTSTLNGVATGNPAIAGSPQVLTYGNTALNQGLTNIVTFQALLSGAIPVGVYDNDVALTDVNDASRNADTGPTASVTVGNPPVFTISKTVSPTSVPSTGGTVTYTIPVKNIGQGASTTVTVQDFLPSTFTYTAGTSKLNGVAIANPTIAGSTLTWAGLGVLASNVTMTLTFSATTGTTQGTFPNDVTASSSNASIIDSGPTASVTVGTAVVVTITKRVTNPNNGPPNNGNPPFTVTYAFDITNTSATTAATNLDITDTLPSGTWAYQTTTAKFQVNAGATTQREPDRIGPVLEWTSAPELASLAPGAVLHVTNVQVRTPSEESGTFNNDVSVSGLNFNVADTGPTAPIRLNGPQYTISKTVTSSLAQPITLGQTTTLTYTIAITNTGTAAGHYDLVDTLPVGASMITNTAKKNGANQGNPAGFPGATLTFGGGGGIAINAGVTDTWTLQATMTENTGGIFYNDALVKDMTLTLVSADTGPTAGVTYGSPPNVTVGKVVNQSNAFALQVVTYTITVTNLSTTTSNATNIDVTDTLAAGFNYQPGTSKLNGVAIANPSGSTGAITWTNIVASLAPGASFTLAFDVQVGSTAGSWTDVADVQGDNFNNVTTGPTATVIVGNAPVLTITKTASPTALPTTGGTVTYTMTISNSAGSTPAGSLVISDTLPAPATYTSGTSKFNGVATGEPSGTTGTITWSGLPDLAGGSSMTLAFDVVFANPTAAGVYSNTASVSGSNFTTKSTGATANVTVGSPPAITIATTVAPGSGTAPFTVTYTVTLTNTGATAGTVPSLNALLPDNMSYVVGSTHWNGPVVADPSGTTGTITWSGLSPNVPAKVGGVNGTITLTFQVTVAAGAVTGTYYVETQASGTNFAQVTTAAGPAGGTAPPVTVTGSSAVTLRNLTAVAQASGVTLNWQTAAEWQNLGFNVYRGTADTGPWDLLTSVNVPGLGTSNVGGTYHATDSNVRPGTTYYYVLEDLEMGGLTTRHGPLAVSVPVTGTMTVGLPTPQALTALPAPSALPSAPVRPTLSDTMGYVTVESRDDTGMTLRLRTPTVTVDTVDGQAVAVIAKLPVITAEGLPRLPVAVIPVGIPGDVPYSVTVLDQQDTMTIADFRATVNPVFAGGGGGGGGSAFQPSAKPSLDIAAPTPLPTAVAPMPVTPAPAQPPATPVNVTQADQASTSRSATRSGMSMQFAFGVLSNGPFPARLAEDAAVGHVHDHRIVQLKLYPVQYDPATRSLTQYRDLRVRLQFHRPVTLVVQSSSEGYFDKAFDLLLAEYDLLSRWNAPISASRDDHAAFRGPAFKLTVLHEGLYQLSSGDLTSAGVNVQDPDHLRLFYRDRELPLDVDTVGGAVSGVRFFAPANTTPYATDSVLFLVNDTVTGARMTPFGAAPSPDLPVATAYETDVLQATHSYWWRQMPDDQASDFWFMDYLDLAFGNRPTSTVSFTLNAPISDPTQPAMVTVGLRGEVVDPKVFFNNHAAVSVNGNPIGEMRWHGNQYEVNQIACPGAYLVDGVNTVQITLLNDRGAAVPVALVGKVGIRYLRPFTAVAGQWRATLPKPGLQAYAITGFASPVLGVYDVTDAEHVRKADGPQIGPNDVRFSDPGQTATHRYWVSDASGLETPAITAYAATDNLHNVLQQADYLVITPAAFRPAAERLAAFRASQGMHTRVVDVQAVYDEFAGGHPEPEGIKAFLAWAVHNWQAPVPTYVLLLGDGSFDYRNDYQSDPATLTQFIPPHLRYSRTIGLTADDNWYACVVGNDELPDVFIGRLPADSADEANTMVDKIIAYEATPMPDWQARAVAVADDKEPSFGQMIQAYTTLYGGLFQWTTLGVLSPQALADKLDAGAGLVLYAGHGGIDLWSNRDVLTVDPGVTNLQATDRPSVFIAANCLTAYFQDPDFPCLGEALLKAPHKGAVAYYAANGFTLPSSQHPMMKRFLHYALDARQPLGAAMAMSKVGLFIDDSALWKEEISSWLLLGDPATTIRSAAFGTASPSPAATP